MLSVLELLLFLVSLRDRDVSCCLSLEAPVVPAFQTTNHDGRQSVSSMNDASWWVSGMQALSLSTKVTTTPSAARDYLLTAT